jgi:hypothetical protein
MTTHFVEHNLECLHRVVGTSLLKVLRFVLLFGRKVLLFLENYNHCVFVFVIFDQNMGNTRNRKRKRPRIAPSKNGKKFKDGEPSQDSQQNRGASGIKIGHVTGKLNENPGHTDSINEGTVFMDLKELFNVFNEVLKCPDCGSKMTSHIDMKKKNGFSHYIVLQCEDTECEWKHCFHSSQKQGPSYNVNVRAVLAFREIGRGHSAMVTFTKIMNMPPPPTSRNYMKIQNQKLLPVVKQLANDSMMNNAADVKQSCGNDEGECGISLDGSWQRRGHVSHNGVVTAISIDTKKCLDVEVMSDKCKGCQNWRKKVNHPKYEEWKANHKCKINHTGSAGSMETAGAVRIFQRSFVQRGLKYKNMLGDGDSSTYNAIVENKPYGDDCIPNKLECIGHVQKRVGSRLRRLKKSAKGVKLSDGKTLGGKGRLTDGKIDILQNYYGFAVRENLDDVNKMATAIKATLFHVASSDSDPQHHLCPDGDDSWCGYKREKESYQHKNGIPKCIVQKIEPVFDDLSKLELLQKCTHGLTQNVNECLNGLIWDRCPKTTYVELETVTLATYLAVLKFNDGDISFLKLFKDLDIEPGVFTLKGAEKCDVSRIKLSAKKSKDSVKKQRKTLRHLRKKYIDDAEEKEGVVYEGGSF